jgi:hypothetical protein
MKRKIIHLAQIGAILRCKKAQQSLVLLGTILFLGSA